MRGKKQGALIAMRTAGCELKLFERQGEAVAPSAGRFKGARSAVQRRKTGLRAGNWQAKAQLHAKSERLQLKRSTLR
jgi:hypothetical protein